MNKRTVQQGLDKVTRRIRKSKAKLQSKKLLGIASDYETKLLDKLNAKEMYLYNYSEYLKAKRLKDELSFHTHWLQTNSDKDQLRNFIQRSRMSGKYSLFQSTMTLIPDELAKKRFKYEPTDKETNS